MTWFFSALCALYVCLITLKIVLTMRYWSAQYRGYDASPEIESRFSVIQPILSGDAFLEQRESRLSSPSKATPDDLGGSTRGGPHCRTAFTIQAEPTGGSRQSLLATSRSGGWRSTGATTAGEQTLHAARC